MLFWTIMAYENAWVSSYNLFLIEAKHDIVKVIPPHNRHKCARKCNLCLGLLLCSHCRTVIRWDV